MNIKMEQVREACGKDDFEYVNAKVKRLMASAKSALLASIGFKNGDSIPDRSAEEFEDLSNTYIVEYVRAMLDQVENEKQLTVLAVQLEGLLHEDSAQGGETDGKG